MRTLSLLDFWLCPCSILTMMYTQTLHVCGSLWSPYVIGQTIIFSCCFFMVALCNRADHNIFMLFLLLSFFSFFFFLA